MRMMMCWIISEYFPVPELSGDAVVYSAVVSCTPERLLVWHIGLQPTHYTNTHGSTLSQIMAQSWAASWWGSAGALLGLVYSLFRERNQGDICFINITFISDCLDNESLHCLWVTKQLLQPPASLRLSSVGFLLVLLGKAQDQRANLKTSWLLLLQ